MVVAIVCDLLSTFLRFRSPWAERLMELGHDVHVIVAEIDVEDTTFFDADRLHLHVEPMERTAVNPRKDLSYCWRIRGRLCELSPDRVVAYQAKAAVWTAMACRTLPKTHVSILFPGLGYLFSQPKGFRDKALQAIARQLYRTAFFKIDVAIFQNPDDVETMRSAGLIRNHVQVHITNGSGVNCDALCQSIPSKDPITFVMATRLLAEKGIREFAEAAKQLKAIYLDQVRFVVAGALDDHPEAITQLELDSWIKSGTLEYAGFVSDMRSFLEASSVFVLPSTYMEGTPRSILEAMAIGRAIITTDHRGCRETVEHGVNGYLITTRETEPLAKAMRRFIEKPELLLEMGNASRNLAVEKYDVRIVCTQMLEALAIID